MCKPSPTPVSLIYWVCFSLPNNLKRFLDCSSAIPTPVSWTRNLTPTLHGMMATRMLPSNVNLREFAIRFSITYSMRRLSEVIILRLISSLTLKTNCSPLAATWSEKRSCSSLMTSEMKNRATLRVNYPASRRVRSRMSSMSDASLLFEFFAVFKYLKEISIVVSYRFACIGTSPSSNSNALVDEFSGVLSSCVMLPIMTRWYLLAAFCSVGSWSAVTLTNRWSTALLLSHCTWRPSCHSCFSPN